MSRKQNRRSLMIALSSLTLCGAMACSESANVDTITEDPFVTSPPQPTLALTEIQTAGSASTDVFFLGSFDQEAFLLRRDGSTQQWSKIPVPPTQGKAVHFVALSSKDIWVLDDNKGQAPSLVHHYDGNAWTQMALDANRVCDKALVRSQKGVTPTVSALCRTGDSYLQYDGGSKWLPAFIPPPDTDTEVLSVEATQPQPSETVYYLVQTKNKKTQQLAMRLAQENGNVYSYPPQPGTERSIVIPSLWTFQKDKEYAAGVIVKDTGTMMFGKAKYYLQTHHYNSKDKKWVSDEMELPDATPKKLMGPMNKEGTDSWLLVEGDELYQLSSGAFASIELPRTTDPLQKPMITDVYSDQSNQVWMTRLLNNSTVSIHLWNNGSWTNEVFTANRLTRM